MKPILSLVILLTGFLLTGCEDKDDYDFSMEAAKDYFGLTPGKYIIYKIDSLVFTQAGRVEERHAYQQKDMISHEIKDATGRPTFVVYRYLRDSAGTQPWASLGTYLITPTLTGVEVIDDNMRVIRLASPVKEGTTWKGNTFLAPEPYVSKFPNNFANDDNMADWDFRITRTGESVNVNGKNYSNVTTVLQVDDKGHPDTITVDNNKAQIGSSMQSVWLLGNATDTVILTGVTPRSGAVRIDNMTNRPAKIGNFYTMPGTGRSFEYFNNNWRYAGNRDSVYTDPPFASKSYLLEKYSKGIGLIYQEIILWEYQPNIGSTPFKVGFGIRRSILEHN